MSVWAPSCKGRAGLEQLRRRTSLASCWSQLGVNYHHLRLDQGLGCTGTAAGRVLGAETGLTFLLSPCTSAGGIRTPCCPGGQGRWGLALVSPSSKDTFWLPPKVSPAAGLMRGWGMPDTWVLIWMGCVLLFHGGISQEAPAPLEWTRASPVAETPAGECPMTGGA